MTRWEVWCEGYRATGEHGLASMMGEATAPTFRDACILVLRTRQHERYFDEKRLTYWGCRLFDNETDARRAYG